MSGPLLVLWSVPRARSTAFLRMVVERGDLLVVHEPFARVSGFGSVAVGERTCRSAREVMDALRALADERPVFVKDTMDRRHPDVLADHDFQRAVTHSVMIRPPEAVVASYLRLDPDATRDAIGFGHLAELYDEVRATTGRAPFVVDGDRLVDAPGPLVAAWCRHAGLPFREAALTWQPGALPEWRPFGRWHEQVAATAGFVPTRPAALPAGLRERAEELVAHHRPFYERLAAHG